MEKTPRGFPIYAEFTDTYGGTVRVQMSSNIDKACWIFYDHPEDGKTDKATGEIVKMAPHLNEAQVRQVIAALKEWLKDN